MKDKFYQYIVQLQDQITSGLEAVDGFAKFREDIWERPEGGGGKTRVIENGKVIEKTECIKSKFYWTKLWWIYFGRFCTQTSRND